MTYLEIIALYENGLISAAEANDAIDNINLGEDHKTYPYVN